MTMVIHRLQPRDVLYVSAMTVILCILHYACELAGTHQVCFATPVVIYIGLQQAIHAIGLHCHR